ncbi:DNA-binding transcriptional LysR family regulator [Microvirga flocculans]|uniref:DNA-binding transcriptional LysR family regulator n=1 Tax=Microvirga flocculans TaxID=217168 RepID=A0A7W6IET4_9HYPH|nr:LysR family transcriptional regulator [Microvirga flocculans]MBB4040175.1 DNA-binding transcriptional LysR family regulator [Microvirga flocculans]
MNLRSVDLNLLVVLDAVLDEAHVSRAAIRLGLSQPATSSALDRCRHLFGDPLLERAGGGMRLTAKAKALREPLKEVLASVVTILDPPQRALADIRQSVRVVMADHPAVIVTRSLFGPLRDTAPGIDLVIMPWHGAADVTERLSRGDVDLAISVLPPLGSQFHRIELLQETYVVAMRKGHPAAAGFNLDAWLSYPHILVSGRGDRHGPLDEALASLGRSRRVGLVMPSFLMVPSTLEASDLIALLPRHCIPPDHESSLAVFEPPIAVQGFPLHMAWHKRRDSDMAVQHVAQLIRDCLQEE